MKYKDRNKAWLGAVLGVASSVVGGLIKKNAQNKAAKEQELAANRKAALESANNLTQAYSDQSYADEYNKKLTMRAGGRFNSNQVSHVKRFSCGGRKKATLGELQPLNPNLSTKLDINQDKLKADTSPFNQATQAKSSFWGDATSDLLDGGINAIGGLANDIITAKSYKVGGKYKAKRK